MISLSGRDVVYLSPGDIFISNQKRKVITVLGSCVALVLYEERYHIGGIMHGMYPGRSSARDTRYTSVSLQRLFEGYKEFGIRDHELTAKLFGGGCLDGRECDQSVGAKNIQLVHQYLKQHGIALQVDKSGGVKGQKLIFFPETGTVYMKYLSRMEESEIRKVREYL